jgi:hypothetical protein
VCEWCKCGLNVLVMRRMFLAIQIMIPQRSFKIADITEREYHPIVPFSRMPSFCQILIAFVS